MEEENKEKKERKFLKKEIIITLIVGILIGLCVMLLVNYFSSTVAKVDGIKISKNELFNKMKKYFPISLVLEDTDKAILDKLYTLDEKMKEEVKKEADEYIESYKNYYGYEEEEILDELGFESYDELIEYLTLYYQRNLYYTDYLKGFIDDSEIEAYYNENAFGEIDSKHILVSTSDDLTEEDALKLAKEIIGKLDKGSDFDTIAQEYQTNYPDNVMTEELGYIDYKDSIEEAYVNALKGLAKGEYTKTPIQTSYGYHIIYCKDVIEKGEMTVVDEVDAVAALAENVTEADEYEKVLIDMRNKYNIKFNDEYLNELYEEYCEPYVSSDAE